MLNLAPIKFANCFASDGGPLHSVEASTIELDGETWAVANARLADSFRPTSRRNVVFGSIDGTGLDKNPLHARFKAISEAIERWAFFSTVHSTEAKRYAFDYDSTSNGMAAFPGFFTRQCRPYALCEAIERYSLYAMWDGKLGMEEIFPDTKVPTRVYRILHPFDSHEVVIVRRESNKGFTVWGYGGAGSIKTALESAILEMERSRILLERYYKQNPGMEAGDLSAVPDMMERRLVYFSMPEGVSEFDTKFAACSSTELGRQTKPKVVFDGELKGPWSKYASVWRVVFEYPTTQFLNPDALYFHW